jgi:hypothetical protein
MEKRRPGDLAIRENMRRGEMETREC